MGCPEASKVQRLLSGDVSARETRRILDHIKECPPCHDRMAFVGDAAPTATSAPGTPRYKSYTLAEVEEARSRPPRGRARGWIALVMVVVLTCIGLAGTRSKKEERPDDPDVMCKDALDAGRPFPTWPRGVIEDRPRMFTTVLPLETTTFTVLVSLEGEAVFSHTYREGDPGVMLDPTTGTTGARTYEALAGFAPFPGEARLPLEPGAPYEYRIRLEGDHVGGPVPFRLLAR